MLNLQNDIFAKPSSPTKRVTENVFTLLKTSWNFAPCCFLEYKGQEDEGSCLQCGNLKSIASGSKTESPALTPSQQLFLNK